jgi:serine/threonine protein phosphatase PrpC
MGCTSSNPKDVDDVEVSPAQAKAQEDAKKQRRRLSVAPEKVGDITAPAPASGNAQEAESSEPVVEDVPVEVKAGTGDSTAPPHTVATQKGHVPYNRYKKNQDRAVATLNLQGDPEWHLFAVMDGHGEYGHDVAEFVMTQLPRYLQLQECLKTDTPKAMIDAVAGVTTQLAKEELNIAFSGTTLVFAVLHKDDIWFGNVGDSRAVMSRDDPGNFVIECTQDQKPDSPEEKKRILAAGGRVAPLPGPADEDCGPFRVWLADVDVPGLAMARSIGDEVSQIVGVISVPEVTHYKIDSKCTFITMATDGVWEFLSSASVMDIVKKAPSIREASHELVAASTKEWQAEEEVIDDITCIIIDLRGYIK